MSKTRAKKKSGLLGFLFPFLVWLAVIFVIVSTSSKFLLAKVLETAIGAPVEINKLNINLFAGEVGIEGLKIRNPNGFNEKLIAIIPEIFIHVDWNALFQNRIHVREIRLNLDEITVERNQSGAVNLMELGAVKKPSKKSQTAEAPLQPSEPSPASQKPAEPAKPPAVQIDTVSLSLGRARYVDYTSGQAVARTFPLEIRNSVLRDVTDPAQITQQIVFKTLQRVGMNALAQQLGVNLDWGGSAGEQLKQAFESFKDKFQF